MNVSGSLGFINFLEYPPYNGLWIKAIDFSQLDAFYDPMEKETIQQLPLWVSSQNLSNEDLDEAIRLLIDNELFYYVHESILLYNLVKKPFFSVSPEEASRSFQLMRNQTLEEERRFIIENEITFCLDVSGIDATAEEFFEHLAVLEVPPKNTDKEQIFKSLPFSGVGDFVSSIEPIFASIQALRTLEESYHAAEKALFSCPAEEQKFFFTNVPLEREQNCDEDFYPAFVVLRNQTFVLFWMNDVACRD